MKTFDFNKFKSERTAKTVGGATAKFICESRGKILVEVTPKIEIPYTIKYNYNGKRYGGDLVHFEDLVNC